MITEQRISFLLPLVHKHGLSARRLAYRKHPDDGWEVFQVGHGDYVYAVCDTEDTAALVAAAPAAIEDLIAYVRQLEAQVNAAQRQPVDETMWVPVQEYAMVRRQLAKYEAQANYIAGIIESEGKYVP